MLQEAMKMIKPEMTVSFGGGSTVARLAKYLCDEKCTQAGAEDVETWPGVVGTSSFFDLCTDVIYEEKGKTIHLRKEDLK